MTHPITPPPELVQEWYHEANLSGVFYENEACNYAYEQHIATRAAQWGAAQELEACCGLLVQQGFDCVDDLRAARRPKPPTLKKQALQELEFLADIASGLGCDGSTIRRALEQLDD